MKTMTMIHIASSSAVTGSAKQAEASSIERSPWHSPVPYLFGGLAAMLGLIAFALLILACSYWRFPRNGPTDEENEPEKRDGAVRIANGSTVYEEEKIVVIMAGEDKPSFLATPANIIFPCTCNCPPHSIDNGNVATTTITTTSLPNHHDDEESK